MGLSRAFLYFASSVVETFLCLLKFIKVVRSSGDLGKTLLLLKHQKNPTFSGSAGILFTHILLITAGVEIYDIGNQVTSRNKTFE